MNMYVYKIYYLKISLFDVYYFFFGYGSIN